MSPFIFYRKSRDQALGTEISSESVPNIEPIEIVMKAGIIHNILFEFDDYHDLILSIYV